MSAKHLITIAALTAFATTAHAQWSATYLNPPGSAFSSANSAVGTQQSGGYLVGSAIHAAVWNGSAGTLVDLHPASQEGSYVTGISRAFSSMQAGFTVSGGTTHAARWLGGVWADFNPFGATRSVINGVDGNFVGYAEFGAEPHAYIWAALSAVNYDLNPAGAVRSVANGISGPTIVGSATFSGSPRAALWTGASPVGWLDLHPAGAVTSVANGVQMFYDPVFGTPTGLEVVGSATFSGNARAGLWNAYDPSGWVDLNPAGATTSVALATWGGQEVGSATFSGTSRASFWDGSAGSWEDLSAYLSGSWSTTVATSIWSDATTTYVSGYGTNGATGLTEALLWTRPVPTPGAAALLGLGGIIAGRRRR